MTLVKAIALPWYIQKSIIVITIWAHVIIARYNAKEKEIRIKNKAQNQKEANKGGMPIFFVVVRMLERTSLKFIGLLPKHSFLLHTDDFVHYLG